MITFWTGSLSLATVGSTLFSPRSLNLRHLHRSYLGQRQETTQSLSEVMVLQFLRMSSSARRKDLLMISIEVGPVQNLHLFLLNQMLLSLVITQFLYPLRPRNTSLLLRSLLLAYYSMSGRTNSNLTATLTLRTAQPRGCFL